MQFIKHYRRTVHRATGESATSEHEFTERHASTVGSALYPPNGVPRRAALKLVERWNATAAGTYTYQIVEPA